MAHSFLIHSDTGDANFLAERLQREGHQVKVFIHDPRARHVGLGLVNLTSTFRPAKGDVVIFDMVKFGKLADQLRASGFKVIGGSRFADAHELDRPMGHRLMRQVQIDVPWTRSFNLAEARAFLQTADKPYFLKPSGNVDSAMTYGAKTPKGMMRFLDYAEAKESLKGKFELQEKKDGIEISTEGWFDGDRWVLPFNSTIEDKKFMPGDYGPNTGCMGNVVWAYAASRPTLCLRTIMRLEPILRAARYVGPVDINTIIDKKGIPWGIEWTMRFGYAALQAFLLMTAGDLGEQLYQFANGTLDRWETTTDELGMVVNVSVPPYPTYHVAYEKRDLPIDPEILSDPVRIMPADIYMKKPNRPLLAGVDGLVMAIGDVGKSVHEMRRSLFDKIDNFEIPDKQARNDACDRYHDVVGELLRLGYETPMMGEGNV
jgi:phosphoribosylamine-glycine ligase